MELYLDPNKRHDFVLLDVTNGNPNGDPDAGNMPQCIDRKLITVLLQTLL